MRTCVCVSHMRKHNGSQPLFVWYECVHVMGGWVVVVVVTVVVLMLV